MPPVPFKIPSWADPQQASVLDSPFQKAARMLGEVLGANDPQAQIMGIAAPIEMPSAKGYLVRGQMQYPINYDVAGKPSATSVFRGVTQDELDSILQNGHIKSTGRYSHSSEGTNFADDFASAHSYVNTGRDNPALTGKPTYVIEVARGPELKIDPRDGYPKSHSAIPAQRIRNVWSFLPDGTMRRVTK